MTEALGPDCTGTNAGDNLRQTLSNVNAATANLSDDTEALKHNFFFRGFFKKRGFYSLAGLSPDQYRSNGFQNAQNQRFWINGPDAFTQDIDGALVLSEQGQHQINQIVGGAKESILNRTIVVEGYSSDPEADRQVQLSRLHGQLVARYLEKRFHLRRQTSALWH